MGRCASPRRDRHAPLCRAGIANGGSRASDARRHGRECVGVGKGRGDDCVFCKYELYQGELRETILTGIVALATC